MSVFSCIFCQYFFSTIELKYANIGSANGSSMDSSPEWINNHMSSKVWDEITYPFLNFNGATVEV